MATHCEKCGTKLRDRKDRFCLTHQRNLLLEMERSGYLQPLTISTVDGANQRLSKRRFLTALVESEK